MCRKKFRLSPDPVKRTVGEKKQGVLCSVCSDDDDAGNSFELTGTKVTPEQFMDETKQLVLQTVLWNGEAASSVNKCGPG